MEALPMIRAIAVLSLLLLPASEARAAEPSSAPAEVYSYRIKGQARWEGDIVARAGITLNSTLPSVYEFCMVPPGADWAAESQDPKIEHDYLLLLDRVAVSDGILGGDGSEGGSWVGACGGVKRVGQIADYQRMDNLYLSNCRDPLMVKQPHKYAIKGRVLVPTGFVAADSLKTLLLSPHPETVGLALEVARLFKRADTIFGPTVAKLVLDAQREEATRAHAAVALGTLVPSELSGKTIASMWLDESLKPETRAAAMNAFAFLVHYGDAHGAKTSAALKTYFPQLKAISREHRDATGKADPLGEAAGCAAGAYSQEIRDAARAK